MLALVAGIMMFTACDKDYIIKNDNEQNPSALKPMTFTASMEGTGGTSRATIDGLDIKWAEGDKISIFDGSTENDGNQAFTLTSGVGTTSGTFKGSAAETDMYYAIYPYAAPRKEHRIPTDEDIRAAFGNNESFMSKLLMYKGGNNWRDDTYFCETIQYLLSDDKRALALAYLNNLPMQIKVRVQLNASNQLERVTFPAEQTVAAGQSVCPNAMLMMARSADAGTLQFKNVCAYVKLTPAFDCTAISIESNDTQMMSGTVTVDYNSGAPTVRVTKDGTNTVTLSGNIAANATYYIAVLPATLINGFTLTFKTPDGNYEKNTDKTLTLIRNHVTDLGVFTKTDLTISRR